MGWTAVVRAANSETISEEQLKLARIVLAGFRDSRAHLRSGVFRFSGTRVIKDPRRKIDHAGEMEGFVAFDFERNVFRIERQEPNYSGQPIGGKYINRGDMAIRRPIKLPQTSILKPTSAPDLTLRMFDIRTAGLGNHAEFESNVPLDRFLDEFLVESNLLEAVKEGGYFRLRWKSAPGTTIAAWFDEDRGFCPVRMESRFDAAPDAPPFVSSELTLIQKDGIWVPETLGMRHTPRPAVEKYVAYVFDWRSVNRELGDELFAVEALNDPGEKVQVTDYRLDQPIVVSDPFGETVELQPSRWNVGRVLVAAFGTLGLLSGILGLRWFAKRRTAR
jgi:hypothetical protein